MIQIDKVKTVEAIYPQTNAGGLTGLYVSLKNVVKVHIFCQVQQAAANTVQFVVNQATTVGGAGVTPITNVVNVWSNLDTAASDVLVSRTAAVNYTTDAGVKNKIVIFEFTPDQGIDNDFDVLNVNAGASSASNLVSAIYVLDTRYSGADLDAN